MYKRIFFAIFFLFSISVSYSAMSVFAATPGDGSASGSNDNKPDGTATPSGDGTTGQDDNTSDNVDTVEPDHDQS